jgi:glycosyltransferase involved in cell wall biosynthesis
MQAPFQKIDLQCLLPDLALQLGDAPFRPAPLPLTGKRVARPLSELLAPTMQHVGVDFHRPRYIGDANASLQPLHRGHLELPSKPPARQSHDSFSPFHGFCLLTGCLILGGKSNLARPNHLPNLLRVNLVLYSPKMDTTTEVISVSVLIPWNNREELSATLSQNQFWMEESNSEVVIVNCGGDQSHLNELLLATDLPLRVRSLYIPTDHFNKSLALNIGLHFSRAKAIFTLDADVVLESNFVTDAIARIHRRAFVTVKELRESNPLAPFLQSRLTEILQAGALSSITTRYHLEFTFHDGTSVRLDTLSSQPSGTRAGIGMLLGSRDNLIYIGGYNSELHHWGWEDDDIVFRLKRVLGLDHFEMGSVLHLTHGDERRSLGGKTRTLSDQNNFYACCERYAREDFQGSYVKDIKTWGYKVLESIHPIP